VKNSMVITTGDVSTNQEGTPTHRRSTNTAVSPKSTTMEKKPRKRVRGGKGGSKKTDTACQEGIKRSLLRINGNWTQLTRSTSSSPVGSSLEVVQKGRIKYSLKRRGRRQQNSYSNRRMPERIARHLSGLLGTITRRMGSEELPLL